MGAKSICPVLRRHRSVSIHAPVMGAKSVEDLGYSMFSVSIHAPVMGAKRDPCLGRQTDCFNPRTRDGCEYQVMVLRLSCLFQSTHP